MHKPGDVVDRLMAYEVGQLGFDETVTLFQELIDSGEVWKLQGYYGRAATTLIELGYCHPAEGEPDPVTGCIHVWAGDGTCIYCSKPKFA